MTIHIESPAAEPGSSRPDWQEIMEELEASGTSPSPPRWLEELEGMTDRLLHPIRRRYALAVLAKRRGASSILFVCVGNLYRSPFAAALFPLVVPEPFRGGVRCDSAGFVGQDQCSPPDAIAAAARRGLDLRPHRARYLSPADVASADLIVVMDAEQKRAICGRYGRFPRDVLILGDLDPHPIRTRAIADPCDQPPHVLEATYDRLVRCVRELGLAVAGMHPGISRTAA